MTKTAALRSVVDEDGAHVVLWAHGCNDDVRRDTGKSMEAAASWIASSNGDEALTELGGRRRALGVDVPVAAVLPWPRE